MPADRPHDYYDPVLTYVDASVRTSTRSREILILIIIASVLIFGALWNSRDDSWLNQRIDMHRKALEYIELREAIRSSQEPAEIKKQKESALKADNPVQDEFLKNRPELKDAKAVENALNRLQGLKTEHVLILKLPFFGIIIDVNDLGMLGGFTFVVLLLWFRSSLWHESNNLHTTLRFASQQPNRRYYYDALAMQQVLTTPPVLDAESEKDDHWSGAVKVLMALPFFVQFGVLWNDIKSWNYGWTVNRTNTIVVVTVSFLFLLGIAWLTRECLKLLKQIAKSWTEYATKVGGGGATSP